MRAYEDLFGDAADAYASHRPGYPEELFEYLADRAPARRLAWDCATGAGQSAVPLSGRFERVVATDISRAQLARRVEHPCVHYAAAAAERAPLPSDSIDLVTISQALHWLTFDRFFAEVERVLVPGGVIAAWTYDLLRIDRAVDAVVDHFYSDVVGLYWLPERVHVVSGYETIPFPFERLEPPALRMSAEWSLERLIGYMSSWSATGRYRADWGEDPVPMFERELVEVWPPAETREVTWNLTLLVGRVGGEPAVGGSE